MCVVRVLLQVVAKKEYYLELRRTGKRPDPPRQHSRHSRRRRRQPLPSVLRCCQLMLMLMLLSQRGRWRRLARVSERQCVQPILGQGCLRQC